jgi:23S rRNA (adenine2503-C2)-methyltransferase
MIHLTKVIDDPNGVVSKLIFEDKTAIAETVAYRYKDRGVVCFSVQSGCRISCKFCGTGKKFIRNLRVEEMLYQIHEARKVIGYREKLEIMAMSMGEPMDNWQETRATIKALMSYDPGQRFYLSTVGLNNPFAIVDIIELGRVHPKLGLQLSLHCIDEAKRRTLLGGFKDLLSLKGLLDMGSTWKEFTKKRCYYNYIATGHETMDDARNLAIMLDGQHLTCSVMCNTKAMKCGKTNPATRLVEMVDMAAITCYKDVEVSMFNPAGQDTVGGGCGQLLYVQKKLKEIV